MRKKKAQSTLEYVLLAGVVLGVIVLIIQNQIKTRVQGLWNKAGNVIGTAENKFGIPENAAGGD